MLHNGYRTSHEIVSDLVHVDIHIVKPIAERPFYTILTSGMSDRPMTVPEGAEAFQYAELMICLPDTWLLHEDELEDESNYWPIRLLKMLARLQHEYDTWLAIDHTVPNGDPSEPYADNTDFVCALLAVPAMEDEDFWRLEVSPDKAISLLQCSAVVR